MEAQGHTSAHTGGPSAGDGVIGGASTTRSTSTYDEVVGFDDVGRLVLDARPKGDVRATIVVASSLFAEFQRNYRREVLLSRRAADAGIRTIRFHYSGAGNSLAGDTPPDLDSMTADLVDVAGGVDGPLVLVGTRVGALAVARVRNEIDVPTVLWEPVIDGTRWVEEVTRAALAREIGQDSSVTADTIRSRWTDDGVAHVLGETVPRTVVDHVAGSDLARDLKGAAPVQIVQMGRSDKVRPDITRFADALGGRGVSVEVLPVIGRQTWWVNEGGDLFRPLERDEATATLVDGIIEFASRAS